MTLSRFGFCGFCIIVLLTFLQGCLSQLTLTAAGPTHCSALVGDTVTLAVSYRGATNPAIVWRKGPGTPILTWTVNSTTPPDVALSMAGVLRVNANGSLVFAGVTLDYTDSYSVEMTKSGLGTASLNFTLTVYEKIENLILRTEPDFALEGVGSIALRPHMGRGVVEEYTWLFEGVEVKPNPRYTVDQRSLVIHNPNRSDSGQYSLMLKNPYSNGTATGNITVLYGPDDPVVTVTPARQFHVSGDSLSLSCEAEGFPPPALSWTFGDAAPDVSEAGVLRLTNVKTSQAGVYLCTAVNAQAKATRHRNVTVNIYEKPEGSAQCSVKSSAGVNLQYECAWPGGSPAAMLSFPKLSDSSSSGRLSINVTASDALNGTSVSCTANHPIQQSTCSITAVPPAPFYPSLGFKISPEGKIQVTISCLSVAVPQSVVSWLRGSEAVSSGSVYTVGPSQLIMEDYNMTTFLRHNYTCSCRNPLGAQHRQVHLLAPTISDSRLLANPEGTVVTLTWEVPPTSIVTGFDIQMLGPDLVDLPRDLPPGHSRSDLYRTIQQKPGRTRSADIFTLNPDETYKFRVVPKARLTEGQPSTEHRIGPGPGLSGSAIAGIAAGIPAGIILLLILIGLLCLLIHARNEKEQARYPVTSEKGMKTKAELASSNVHMAGHFGPDYSRFHQAPSERSMDLPMFVPPPPVRVATTV